MANECGIHVHVRLVFDEVALWRPNTGSFSTKTIIKKNKNNNQMAQKLQTHANSQCVLEMIWQVFQLLFYRHVWFYRLNKMQNLCCFASLHLVWGLQKKKANKINFY